MVAVAASESTLVCTMIDPVSAVSTAPAATRSARVSPAVTSRIDRAARSVAVLPVATTLPRRMSASTPVVVRLTAPLFVTLVARIAPTEVTVTVPAATIDVSSSPAEAPVPTSRIESDLPACWVVAESTATSVSRSIEPVVEVRKSVWATISAAESTVFSRMLLWALIVTVPVVPALIRPTLATPPRAGEPTVRVAVAPVPSNAALLMSRPSSSVTTSTAFAPVSVASSPPARVVSWADDRARSAISPGTLSLAVAMPPVPPMLPCSAESVRFRPLVIVLSMRMSPESAVSDTSLAVPLGAIAPVIVSAAALNEIEPLFVEAPATVSEPGTV